MCAGYELDTDIHAIERAFRVDADQLELPLGLSQYFPKARAPIVIAAERDGHELRRLGLAQLGFVPAFAEDARGGARLYNARAETAADKPTFRRAFEKRRCLVPLTGFYEWAHVGKRSERRTFRARDGGLFALAGLWEVFHPPGEERLVSFAILTTAPSGLVAPIHHRMPVVVPVADYDRWLAPRTPRDALHALLVPRGEELLALAPAGQPGLLT